LLRRKLHVLSGGATRAPRDRSPSHLSWVIHYIISPDAAFAAVEDGAVVLHMRTKRYYSLNETGTFVWRRLEDGVDRGDIVVQVVAEYDVGIAEAEIAVARLLEELMQEGLIQVAEPA
jgi:hypothetical protein